MTDKQYLAEIEKIINASESRLDKKITNLADRTADLEDQIKDTKSDLELTIINLKMELVEETKKLGRRIREIKQTLDLTIKHFDGGHQETRKRVSRIESQLKLPPIN